MSKFSKIFTKVFAAICVCLIATITLFATGIIETPVFLDIYQDKQYEGTSAKKEQDKSSIDQSSSNKDTVTITTTTSTTVDVSKVPSVLRIELTGNYLTAFNKSVKTIPSDDKKSQVLIKVALQILQSKTICYENALHFYSLDYSASAKNRNRTKYSLRDCVTRINNGHFIYTDCFGFVRLAHSIAAFTLNNKNPENVSGLNGLYGYRGAYSQGSSFNSLKKLKTGAVIFDTLTGIEAGYSSHNRHVAMYLYSSGTEVVFADQSGLHTGTFTNGNHIYSKISKTPYKFDKFKNFN